MYKMRGIRLPVNYFLENHLFDILNRTNTHRWLPVDDYEEEIENLKHGFLYMCSWTSIIKEATEKAIEISSFDLTNADFIDVGCGKGKVLLVWKKYFSRFKNIKIIGIDYSKNLLDICEKNARIKGIKDIELWNTDVTTIDPSDFRENMLCYLYNPFNEQILDKFLANLTNKNICLIYNNPQYLNVLTEHGFRIIHQVQGWHPNATYTIFSNR
jgi:SAM-dependent methyltransferase